MDEELDNNENGINVQDVLENIVEDEEITDKRHLHHGREGNKDSPLYPDKSWRFSDSTGKWGDTSNATQARETKIRRRQKVFLQAYHTIGNFNASEACRAIGMNRCSVDRWKKIDEWFREQMESIEEEKKDFIESKLMQRIRRNDTAAIIFAAKTKLRDRGYGEHRTIEQTHKHTLSKEQIDSIARAKRSKESIINVTPIRKRLESGDEK